MALTKAQLIDLNANELILDLDADTSLTADTDDQIDIKIGGADDFTFTANAFNILTGSHATFADSANAKFGTGSDMLVYHDGSNSYITNAVGALKIATETSGIALTIGHTTSEVTIADNLTVTGTLTLGSGAELTEAELEFLDGITAGTAAASKALVLDGSKNIATIGTIGSAAITSSGIVTATGFTAGSAVLAEAELELLDGLTAGTAIATKVVTTDGSIDTSGQRNLTITGELDAATGDFSGVVDVAGAFTTGSTIVATSTIQGTSITATTSFLPDAQDGAALGTTSLQFSDLFLADGAVIGLGDDNEVTITHVADTGILINSTNVIQFNDASQNIGAPSNAILDINATDEIELNATLVDINANVEISGTATTTGVHTFSATPVFPDGSLALADLDIDGGTDINAAIVDADLFIVDDGASGANRKVTASRIKTYAGASGAITGITSVLNTSLVLGRDADNDIDFTADNIITFRAAAVDQVKLIDNVFSPVADSDVDLGTSSLYFKDTFFDTIRTTGIGVFGSPTSTGAGGYTGSVQVQAANTNPSMTLNGNMNNDGGVAFVLSKSRNTTVGSNTIVQDNDVVASIFFAADDGTNMDCQPANIVCKIDGTPGENDTPGELLFGTTADGAANPTTRLTISPAGLATFSGAVTVTGVFEAKGGAIFNEGSADVDFRIESNGNANAIFVDAGNDRVGIGTGTVDTGGKCLTLKAMGSAGPQLILHQYNAADGWEFNAEDATGHLTIADSSAEEIFRFDDTGQLSSGGETAADVGAGGLCLDQNAIDTNILTFKSSDTDHPNTNNAETDTYGRIKKYHATDSGLFIHGFGEGNQSGMHLKSYIEGTALTGEAINQYGVMEFNATIISGTGTTTPAADGNAFTFECDGDVEFIVKGDGELFSNQSATVGTYDTYDDAQLVRAFDLNKGENAKGLIDSKFDKFVKYNQKDLMEAKLIGKDENGKPTSFVNITGMSRLHNGAIWQQYEKHERLLEAVYDLATVAVGEEKANAILDKHEVKRLQ